MKVDESFSLNQIDKIIKNACIDNFLKNDGLFTNECLMRFVLYLVE